MKITFLGTGAADWPLNKTNELNEFRRFSSALVDDTLLIDPGPGVMDALKEFGKSPNDIKYIINTHDHGDHYNINTINTLTASGSIFISVVAGQTLTVGDYTISAYTANHSTCEKAVHFIISDGEKRLFYGLDGAWLMYDEVAAIKSNRIDYAVFDATIGDIDGDYRIFEHNNLNMILEMKKTLDPFIGRFCISHMARTLHADHNTLSDKMSKHNIEVAFDGYETTF